MDDRGHYVGDFELTVVLLTNKILGRGFSHLERFKLQIKPRSAERLVLLEH